MCKRKTEQRKRARVFALQPRNENNALITVIQVNGFRHFPEIDRDNSVLMVLAQCVKVQQQHTNNTNNLHNNFNHKIMIIAIIEIIR